MLAQAVAPITQPIIAPIPAPTNAAKAAPIPAPEAAPVPPPAANPLATECPKCTWNLKSLSALAEFVFILHVQFVVKLSTLILELRTY